MRTLPFALLAALLVSCSTEPTQVVIVVDGEFDTPTEVDRLELIVTNTEGTFVTSVATFDGVAPGFPRTLGVLRGGGPSGQYQVEVTARKAGNQVVRRVARFHFVSHEIRMLRIDLLRACAGVVCNDDRRTCGEGGLCERVDVPTDPWTGAPTPQFDAGTAVTPIVAP